MALSKQEKIDIGKQLYEHTLTRREAIQQYNVSDATLGNCLTEYRKSAGIHIVTKKEASLQARKKDILNIEQTLDIDAYMAMSKEELIDVLILAKANELRAKKGYEVKGFGANKEFISLSDKNTK